MTEVKSDLIVSDEILISKIYYIRGCKVMLDRDLAELYGVEPIRLREQVKRNADRFPANFIFQLTEDETDSMVSQIAIPSKQHLGGHLPLKLEQLERKVDAHDGNIQAIFKYLKQFLIPVEQAERQRVGFRRPEEQG